MAAIDFRLEHGNMPNDQKALRITLTSKVPQKLPLEAEVTVKAGRDTILPNVINRECEVVEL